MDASDLSPEAPRFQFDPWDWGSSEFSTPGVELPTELYNLELIFREREMSLQEEVSHHVALLFTIKTGEGGLLGK